jgi:hypothetical protein
MKRWVMLCVGLPGTLVIVGLTLWMAASWLGLPFAAAGDDITLSEAALLADHADVTRLISKGADPNAPARLRPGLFDFSEHVMSPLEAATRSRQSGIMRLLTDSGAGITATNYPDLWCSANRVPNNGDVMAFLAAHRPAGFVGNEACQP